MAADEADLEIEMKFSGADFAVLEKKLRDLGAWDQPVRLEIDQYFSAPHRDFAATDEALRLRRIATASFVTYKGPKIDSHTKTRAEVEVPLGHGDQAAQDFTLLLGYLGFKPVAVVRKHRRIFSLDRDDLPLEVCLDEVEEVGRFVELEICAPPSQLDAARSVITNLAKELRLTAAERRSYLELLLAKRSSK